MVDNGPYAAPFVIDADDPLRLSNEALDDVARPSLRPVRLLREVVVDGVDVDASDVVVELDAVA